MTDKIFVVTGATGLIGRQLCRQLQERGDEVIIFSRNPQKAEQVVPGCCQYQAWSSEMNRASWAAALEGVTGVIHLAGMPVFGQRWDAAYKEAILTSRTQGTTGLVQAMAQCNHPPEVFVCASAIGYYGFRDDTPLTEDAPAGSDFLAQVCVQWEAAARAAQPVRTTILRLGIVLDAKEGALAQMLPPFQKFVGGPLGSGKQWFSWIHLIDMVGTILYALDHHEIRGIYNCTAPNPQRMVEFCQTLGGVLGRPSWLPVPRVALEVLIGEAADILVEGQRVIPQRLLQAGYQFRYPQAQTALQSLL